MRDLGAAAAVLLYVTDLTLDYRELWFVMKHAGYRSEETSIYYALRRGQAYGLVTRTWATRRRRPTRERLRAAMLKELLGRRAWPRLRPLLERAKRQRQQGLAERERRLQRSA